MLASRLDGGARFPTPNPGTWERSAGVLPTGTTVVPTSGTARVAGRDVAIKPLWARVEGSSVVCVARDASATTIASAAQVAGLSETVGSTLASHHMDAEDFGDGARCPFCGQDAAAGGWGEVCAHLVADWSLDPEDNGGGVLGDARCGQTVDSAYDLALACQALQAAVIGSGDDGWDRRFAALQTGLPGNERPSWWPSLCDAVAAQADEPIGDTPTELGTVPTAIMLDVLNGAPGIKITTSDIGGMTSGVSCFVWSEHQGPAQEEIGHRVAQAARLVRQAIAQLSA